MIDFRREEIEESGRAVWRDGKKRTVGVSRSSMIYFTIHCI
jgi:hypothetical protein